MNAAHENARLQPGARSETARADGQVRRAHDTPPPADALAFALAYARRGWPVFPLAAGKKRPAVAGGFKMATADLDQVRKLFLAGRTLNLGIATGAACWVLDLDGPAGEASLEKLVAEHGPLPATLVQRTCNGGRHLLFRAVPGLRCRVAIRPGLDVRAGGGYIVAEPSFVAPRPGSGGNGRYGFEDWIPTEGDAPEIAAAPEWLIEIVRVGDMAPAPAAPAVPQRLTGYLDPQRIADLRSAMTFIDADPRDKWLQVGMALHSTDAPEAFELWAEWSKSSSKYRETDQQKAWASFKSRPGGLHVEAIFAMAKKAGWHTPTETPQLAPSARKDAPAKPHEGSDRVELLHAADLKPEPIRWIWRGWLARGKLHVLAGAPGTGKTTLAMELAACVTSGRALPSGSRPQQGHVLIWSGEDDPADTLVPRLIAAGAVLSKVRFVGEVVQDGKHIAFDPARDVPKLAAACAGIDNIALLIVDPIVSAVSGDSHKNAEVRRGLAPLVELAAKLDAALLGITHYSKGTQGRDPLERVSGSLAFGALARVVLGTIREPVHSDAPAAPRGLIVARAKSNIGPDGGGFKYAFEQVELTTHPGISASKIVWGSQLSGSASQLLGEPELMRIAKGAQRRDNGEVEDAASFLRELLETGPLPVKEIRKHGDDAGYAWRTVQRAMRSAGVTSKRGGFGQPATWSLDSCATVAPVAPHPESGANGATGQESGATAPDLSTEEKTP